MSVFVDLSKKEPSSVKQALSNAKWFESMNQDFNTLIQNKTWVLVLPPFNKTNISSKWTRESLKW